MKKLLGILALSLLWCSNVYAASISDLLGNNKSRSFYVVKLLHDTLKLPLLTNDTNDIIEYRNDVQEFADKRKKRNKRIMDLLD